MRKAALRQRPTERVGEVLKAHQHVSDFGIHTAQSVTFVETLLTFWPPGPELRAVSNLMSCLSMTNDCPSRSLMEILLSQELRYFFEID